MEAQSLSTCNQCGKKFQRKAHLLRHQQQHSGDRPYSCKFCSKTFKRSDVLRDHFSRCERRGTAAIPSSLERGRKRHACDECSRLKIKCDNQSPCAKCIEFGRVCVKSRPTAASSPEGSTTTTPGSDRNSIGFLLNCPGETDFMREFPKDNTMSPRSQTSDFTNTQPVRNGYEPMEDVSAVPIQQFHEFNQVGMAPDVNLMLSGLEFEHFERASHGWQLPVDSMLMLPSPDGMFMDRDVLERRAFDIREKIRYAASTMNLPHVPSNEILQAIEQITAPRISAWIKLYFKHWHKHCPIVHEASFNPCTAALPMVLAMMSLGGMYSPAKDDVSKLKLLLDTIEFYVYSIPGLSDEYDNLPDRAYVRRGESASFEWQRFQLEELQGAYLTIIIQYWTGNPIARTRVRQQRFSRVAAIMHHLEMFTIQHSPNFVITDEQSFRFWILKESYIRTATIATMLDNVFGIMNNVVPRFQWAEIDLAFPSYDRHFRLTSYAHMVATNEFPGLRMKIKDAFMILFSPPSIDDTNLNVLKDGNLTALDMQILIHFLYTHVWTSLFTNPLLALPGTSIPALVHPYRVAMRSWRIIWDGIKFSAPEAEWNKLGFCRTAETYFDAITAIVDLYERKGGKFPCIPSDCEKGSHLRRLLGEEWAGGPGL